MSCERGERTTLRACDLLGNIDSNIITNVRYASEYERTVSAARNKFYIKF